MIAIYVVGAAAVIAVVVAIKKHGSLTAAEASLKKEIANLEALTVGVKTAAKNDFSAVVARLKSIF